MITTCIFDMTGFKMNTLMNEFMVNKTWEIVILSLKSGKEGFGGTP
jgi:hypothetical protein|tara:strand:- start:12432 stop:12569 length:138 start_codon:yes stop_codon:yes gene_type:complete